MDKHKQYFIKDIMASTNATEEQASQLYDLLSSLTPTPEMVDVVEKNISEEAVPFDGGASGGEALVFLLCSVFDHWKD